ncbi:MAG: glycine cleavage T C-terminal barrel domain-containing protein [Pyrinomonadaceae bacterium]
MRNCWVETSERGLGVVNKGEPAIFADSRGLIRVGGAESVQFLNGLVTNDVAGIEEGEFVKAAFSNAKGRLQALARILRLENSFYIETEEITRDFVFQNLNRFTLAGDFTCEDLSPDFRFYSLFNADISKPEGTIEFGRDVFVRIENDESFRASIPEACELSKDAFEIIRIEEGRPLYGVDVDESTVIPEMDIADLIHYKKGCYIGQEVIARIFYLGKPANLLRGLMFEEPFDREASGSEILDAEGKKLGHVTSSVYSPVRNCHIGLGFVKNAFAEEGTKVFAGGAAAVICSLPFAAECGS